MPGSRRNVRAVGLTAAAVLLAAPATAQFEPGEWFSLRPGPPALRVELAGSFDTSPADRNGGEFGRLAREELRLSLPMGTGGVWSVGMDGTRIRLPGSPRLDPGGAVWPAAIWNAGVSLGHRRRLEGGRLMGGTLRLGGSGDAFLGDGVTVQVTGFMLLPAQDRNAWVVAFNYSSDREFLRGIPIPGGGYLLRRGERLTTLLGVPFFLDTRVAGPLRARVSFLPSRTYSVRLSAPVHRSVTAFSAFESEIDRARRTDRSNAADRLFLAQRLVRAGLELDLGAGVRAEVSAGRIISRTLVEGRDFSHRARSTRRMPDGNFLAVRLRASLDRVPPAAAPLSSDVAGPALTPASLRFYQP